MNEVDHVPQSLASHTSSYLWGAQREEHGADMLKPDPRDTFFLSKWQLCKILKVCMEDIYCDKSKGVAKVIELKNMCASPCKDKWYQIRWCFLPSLILLSYPHSAKLSF